MEGPIVTATTTHRPPTPTSATESDPTEPLYRERAHLVADLAARWRSVLVERAPDLPQFAIVYIHTVAGQMSWHINPTHLDLFGHVRVVDADHPLAQWDGHTTTQKYARLRALRSTLPSAPPAVVGERVSYRDGRGHTWITTDNDHGRLRSRTPDHAPDRHDTLTAVLAATGTLVALGNAQ
ncbi:hypothetical protein ACIRL2_45900 [Embleya sp. NPDC127516]|uniref:WDGH domain-containing protein n=1 Tax=Embleya sp. NPDC127516 TaxID=3363990 RepID=UPI0037F4B9F4